MRSTALAGSAPGRAGPGGYFFGITEKQIRCAMIGGSSVALTTGNDDSDIKRAGGDFRLVEL